MTAQPPGAGDPRLRRVLTQLMLVVLINVPSVSFGLAMGWVSLESGGGGAGGGGGEGDEGGGAALVAAAAATFLAGALATPVAARALAAGRKPAMLATSLAFVLCWSCKLCGGWGVVAGRAAAGLGGAAAWVIPPMLAGEMCCARVRGAASAALVLAHNAGFLLMYLAADYCVPHTTVLVCCLGLSLAHLVAYLFVPESPAYLAAHGSLQEARAALAWCRGYPAGCTSEALDAELKELPAPDLTPSSPCTLARDMLSDVRRRKAFMIALVTVVGQEMCGVLSLLQFAERVFSLVRDEGGAAGAAGAGGGRRPASDAVVLGAVQLVASAAALYLVEKIGRRPLLVWGAVLTGVCLGAGSAAVALGVRGGALAALAAAVAADSAGLQPAPYALLPEMFTYQYRGCAVLLVTAAADLGNAIEIVVFTTIVHSAGLAPALALAAVLTLALAVFAVYMVPETMDRTPEEIYEILCPGFKPPQDDPTDISVDKSNGEAEINNDDKEFGSSTDDEINDRLDNVSGDTTEKINNERKASVAKVHDIFSHSNDDVNTLSPPLGISKDASGIADVISPGKQMSKINDDYVILYNEHSKTNDTIVKSDDMKENGDVKTKNELCSLNETMNKPSDIKVHKNQCSNSIATAHLSTVSEVNDAPSDDLQPVVVKKSEQCSKETEFTNM